MGLVSLQAVKAYLGKAENGEDTLLTVLIDGVTGLIEAALGEVVASGEDVNVSDRLDSNGFATLTALRRIKQVVSLTENGTALTEGTGFEVTGDRTLVRLDSGEVSRWACGEVVVTYRPGWATVPADLVHAALIQTAFEYSQTKAGGNRIGLASNSPGGDGESVSYLPHDLLPEVRRAVLHRRMF